MENDAISTGEKIAMNTNGGNANEWPRADLQLDHRIYRTSEDDEAFRQLVDSVRAQGILQPLLITPDGTIVAGARRFAAAVQLQLDRVPVRVLAEGVNIDAVPLIENLMRADLKPMEIASYLADLRATYDYSNDDLSAITGISRGTISGYLRIHDGPEAIKQMVNEDQITIGGAVQVLRKRPETVAAIRRGESEALESIRSLFGPQPGRAKKTGITYAEKRQRDISWAMDRIDEIVDRFKQNHAGPATEKALGCLAMAQDAIVDMSVKRTNVEANCVEQQAA